MASQNILHARIQIVKLCKFDVVSRNKVYARHFDYFKGILQFKCMFLVVYGKVAIFMECAIW